MLGILLAVGSAQSGNTTLSDLIPTGKWEAAGLSRLTDSERGVLRNELLALLKRYHSSLTDGVALIAPSVSTSIKAREIRVQLRKPEVPLRYAEAILVVVRSSLFD